MCVSFCSNSNVHHTSWLLQAALQLMLRLPAALKTGTSFDFSTLRSLLLTHIEAKTVGQIVLAWLAPEQAGFKTWTAFLASLSKLEASHFVSVVQHNCGRNLDNPSLLADMPCIHLTSTM